MRGAGYTSDVSAHHRTAIIELISPVVGVFIPGGEGHRQDTGLAGEDKCIRGHGLKDNIAVRRVRRLKTANDADKGRVEVSIEEKLWPRLNTVTNGILWGVVEEFGVIVIVIQGGQRDQKALRIIGTRMS
ncbi:hypothetical protein CYD30_28575 [Kosakonia cowanii]|nr:hypothetical protein CYD30_28575 [Kosakonia cowanii]